MKKNIHTLLIFLLACAINNTVHAYRWVMNNFTSKTLLVQIELLLSKNPYFVLVEPMHSADFDWSPGNVMAGFCLGKVKYVVVDNYLLDQANLINKSTMEVVSNQKLLDWLDKYADAKTAKAAGLAKPYERKTADVQLVKDELFSTTIEQAKKLMGTKFGAKIVGHFADLIAKSKCRGRDIFIVEQGGKIEFYTLEN